MLQCVAVYCSTRFLVEMAQKTLADWCVLQCVSACSSVLQCIAVCRSVLQHALCCGNGPENSCRRVLLQCSVLQCVAVVCSVFHVVPYVAVCCNALQCVLVCCSLLQCVGSLLQCVAVCCSVRITTLFTPDFYFKHMIALQHVATRHNTLQHVATCIHARLLLETYDYVATRRNTLHHAATRCNTLQHVFMPGFYLSKHHDYVMSHP